eukprot:Phypoly_transcript_19219.p1 GENE.Phypoly_transcript_19219~~Phypoly_transcript_19219.p1  ORF type:complete len:210 (+),score=20.98 Phypoly_transcript_19219:27-632(+)
MGILRNIGRLVFVTSGITLGTVAYLGHRPQRIPTPLPVIVHSSIWNPEKHRTKDDTYEIRTHVLSTDKDLLLEMLRGYFLCLPFKPQDYLMRRYRIANSEKTEQWDLSKLTREDLQPGKFLFDKFEVAQVDKHRIWIRFPIGLLVLEAKEVAGGEALLRFSTVFWDPKEDKPPIPPHTFYSHLLYQRLLVQGAASYLEKKY